jgi:hypothetical protein
MNYMILAQNDGCQTSSRRLAAKARDI